MAFDNVSIVRYYLYGGFGTLDSVRCLPNFRSVSYLHGGETTELQAPVTLKFKKVRPNRLPAYAG